MTAHSIKVGVSADTGPREPNPAGIAGQDTGHSFGCVMPRNLGDFTQASLSSSRWHN